MTFVYIVLGFLILLLPGSLALNLWYSHKKKVQFDPTQTDQPKKSRLLVGMAPIPRVTTPHQNAGAAFSMMNVPVMTVAPDEKDQRFE